MKTLLQKPSTSVFRSGSNSHRFICFVDGKFRSFTTNEKDFLFNLASLYSALNGVWSFCAGRVFQKAAIALFILLNILITPMAFALPTGWQVVEGDVNVEVNGDTLNITSSSQNAIINYQSFDVASHETVNFNFLLSGSSILNRILGSNASSINGAVNANAGIVGLINTNGIAFGTNANINVGSLIASTLDISNHDFLAGRFQFKNADGQVAKGITNEGSIQAENFIAMNASAIQNTGQINAASVALAVGDAITLNMSDNVAVNVTVDEALIEKVATLQDAISNTGDINASVIEIEAELAQNLYDKTVNNSGVIRAAAVDMSGGKIRIKGHSIENNAIVMNTGTIDATGTTGGDINVTGDINHNTGDVLASGTDGTGGHVELLGDQVALYGDALVDASGTTGGGEILVGGDFRGQNANVQNADKTWVTTNVDINADATLSGDAGKVIVWADNSTQFYGDISATSVDGKGGFVEVSGKQSLNFQGDVDLKSQAGDVGDLLLDPTDIMIVDGAGADDAQLDDNTILNADAPATMIIGETKLESLAGNATVRLEASNDITVGDLSDDLLSMQTEEGRHFQLIADYDNNGSGTLSFVDNNDMIRTEGGHIQLYGAALDNIGKLDTTGVANDKLGHIYLYGDSMDFQNTIKTDSSRNTYLYSRNNNRDFELNNNLLTDAEPLDKISLSNAELNLMDTYAIIIGQTDDTNTVTIADNISQGTNAGLYIYSKDGIVVDGSLTTSGGHIVLQSNSLDINNNVTTLGTSRHVYLRTAENARDIEVGSGLISDAEPLDRIHLSTAELDLVSSASWMYIGETNDTGNYSITADVLNLQHHTAFENRNAIHLTSDIDISSNNKAISFRADSLDIDGTINSGTQNTYLRSSTNIVTNIVNGGTGNVEPVGHLEITTGEINRVTGGILIGIESYDAGLTVDGDINHDGNIYLRSAGTTTINGSLSSNNNHIELRGDTLDINNTVNAGTSSVALYTGTGASNNTAIEVGTGLITDAEPVGVMHISQGELGLINSHQLTIGESNDVGSLTVSDDITAERLVLANKDLVKIDDGVAVTTTESIIQVYGDTIDIDGTIDTGTSAAYFYQSSLDRAITLGSGLETDIEPVGSLHFNQGELDNITAATVLFGRTNDTVGLTVESDITKMDSSLYLRSGAHVTIDPGATLTHGYGVGNPSKGIYITSDTVNIDGNVTSNGWLHTWAVDANRMVKVEQGLTTDAEPLGHFSINQGELDNLDVANLYIGNSSITKNLEVSDTVSFAKNLNLYAKEHLDIKATADISSHHMGLYSDTITLAGHVDPVSNLYLGGVNVDLTGTVDSGNLYLRPRYFSNVDSSTLYVDGPNSNWNIDYSNITTNQLLFGIWGNDRNMAFDSLDLSAYAFNTVTMYTQGFVLDGSAGSETPNIKLNAATTLSFQGYNTETSTHEGTDNIGTATVDGDFDIDLGGTGTLVINSDDASAYIEIHGGAALGTIDVGTGGIQLTVNGGSLTDANGAGANIIAGSDSSINIINTPTGTIGTGGDSIELDMTGATISITSSNTQAGTTVNLSGNADGVVHTGGIPGDVVFNSVIIPGYVPPTLDKAIPQTITSSTLYNPQFMPASAFNDNSINADNANYFSSSVNTSLLSSLQLKDLTDESTYDFSELNNMHPAGFKNNGKLVAPPSGKSIKKIEDVSSLIESEIQSELSPEETSSRLKQKLSESLSEHLSVDTSADDSTFNTTRLANVLNDAFEEKQRHSDTALKSEIANALKRYQARL